METQIAFVNTLKPSPMTERWKRYIAEGIEAAGGPIPFALTQWMFLLPVFLAIKRALPSGGKLLDIGCGAGIFTALLSHHGFHVVGVDEDSDIVAYARKMIDFFHSSARVERRSAFDLSPYHDQFDLAFSLGVVEHYEPEVTVQLIREHACCSRLVLIVVPTHFTPYAAPVTDERLYTRGQCCDLVRAADLRIRESFLFGEVPSRMARNAERLLPGVIYRRVKHLSTYGMGICCLGERGRRTDRGGGLDG